MSVAIVGGTGFLGSAIARALVARGADVLQIARGRRGESAIAGASFAMADKADEAALDRILGNGVTSVIDVMTLTLATTRPLLAATARAGAQYVMISAIDVTANYGGLARLETPPVLDRPTREDDPLRTVLYPYRQLTARPAGIDPDLLRDYDKIPIEGAARAMSDLRALILRLPALFGPDDPQGRFRWLKEALAAGGPVRLDARFAAWPQSFLFIEDAAKAIATATLAAVPGQTLHIATPHIRSMHDWAERFVAVSGRQVPVLSVAPRAGGLMAERAEAMDLRYPLTLDGGRFAARFGPVDRTPEDAAIAAELGPAMRIRP